jgi:hypothetical protein
MFVSTLLLQQISNKTPNFTRTYPAHKTGKLNRDRRPGYHGIAFFRWPVSGLTLPGADRAFRGSRRIRLDWPRPIGPSFMSDRIR